MTEETVQLPEPNPSPFPVTAAEVTPVQGLTGDIGYQTVSQFRHQVFSSLDEVERLRDWVASPAAMGLQRGLAPARAMRSSRDPTAPTSTREDRRVRRSVSPLFGIRAAASRRSVPARVVGAAGARARRMGRSSLAPRAPTASSPKPRHMWRVVACSSAV